MPRGQGREGCTRSQQRGHTHPAQARHSQGDARLEVIRVLFAETGDEADSSCDHALQGQMSGRSGPWWKVRLGTSVQAADLRAEIQERTGVGLWGRGCA